MIAVVGAGFSGAVIARMLQEKGYYVMLYEEQAGPGGILSLLQDVTLTLADYESYNWISARVPLLRVGEISYAPAQGYITLCEQLLTCRDVRVQYSTPITDAWGIAHAFDKTIYTGNLEKIFCNCFGPLPYSSSVTPLESAEARVLLQHYLGLCAKVGIIPFGVRPAHTVLPMHVLLKKAWELMAHL